MKTRPKCLECSAPADVLVSGLWPYCAKHGLIEIKKEKPLHSKWNSTNDKRSQTHAT